MRCTSRRPSPNPWEPAAGAGAPGGIGFATARALDASVAARSLPTVGTARGCLLLLRFELPNHSQMSTASGTTTTEYQRSARSMLDIVTGRMICSGMQITAKA